MLGELPHLRGVRVFRTRELPGRDGLCFIPTGPILISSSLRGQLLIETLIHEGMHLMHPEFKEKIIDRDANDLTTWLWKCGVRMTELRQRPV